MVDHGRGTEVDDRSPYRRRIASGLAVGVAAAVAALLVFVAGDGDPGATHAGQTSEVADAVTGPGDPGPSAAQAPAVPADLLATLPEATTFARVAAAPVDSGSGRPPAEVVVHPTLTVPGFAAPGGDPIVAVPSEQPVGLEPAKATVPTWLPVLERQPGWVRVALPSRPNNSTAWLASGPDLAIAAAPFSITVDIAERSMRLRQRGVLIGQWTVGVGAPSSVTPTGRTFLLAVIRNPQATYSPVLLALGTHSETYDTYSGGPGTVAIHGWPEPSAFGTATSDGCVRIPSDALHTLTTVNDGRPVPLGTPVHVG